MSIKMQHDRLLTRYTTIEKDLNKEKNKVELQSAIITRLKQEKANLENIISELNNEIMELNSRNAQDGAINGILQQAFSSFTILQVNGII